MHTFQMATAFVFKWPALLAILAFEVNGKRQPTDHVHQIPAPVCTPSTAYLLLDPARGKACLSGRRDQLHLDLLL